VHGTFPKLAPLGRPLIRSEGLETRERFRPSAGAGSVREEPPALPALLRFERGKGLIALEQHELAPGVVAERIDLAIPHLKFPFDVTGGARRFQSHKLRLEHLVLRIDLTRAAAHARAALAEAGCERVTLVGRAGGVDAVVEGGPATLALRILVESSGPSGLRLLATDVRPLGPLADPPLLAAARLLARVIPGGGADGLANVVHDPVRTVLRRILPAHGWRLPFTDGVVLCAIEVEPDALRLSFAQAAPATAAPGTTIDDARRVEAEKLASASDAALAAGDPARARTELLVALDRAPRQPDLLERLAGIDATDPERAPAALALADELAAAEPRPTALALAAMAALSAGRPDVAADRLEALSLADPVPLARAIAARAAAARLAHRAPDRAVRLYEAALAVRREDPTALWAVLDLSVRLRRRLDLEKVVPRLLAATAVLERAAVHARLARVWLDAWRDTAAARAEAERALRIDPEHEDALRVMAALLAQAGDSPRALRAWDRVAAAARKRGDPSAAADALVSAGRLWRATGKDDSLALARFSAAIDAAPEHVDALALRAKLRAAQGDAQAASIDWQRALAAAEVQVREDLPALRVLVARHMLEAAGDLDGAEKLLAKAWEARQDDPEILSLVESVLYLRGRWAEIVDLLRRRAASPAPSEKEGRVARLREAARIAHEHLDDAPRARTLLEEATRIGPDDLGAWEARAKLAGLAGDDADAVKAWTALAKLRARPDGRAAALLALSEIEEKLTDLVAAERYALRAGEEAPGQRGPIERLVVIRRRRAETLPLAEALGRLAAAQKGAGQRAEAFLALVERAKLLLQAGRHGAAAEAADAAMPLVRREERGPALRVLLDVAAKRGESARVRAAFEELEALGRVTEKDRLAAAAAARDQGDLALSAALAEAVLAGSDPDAAERAASLLLETSRATGDPKRVADALGRVAARTADSGRGADLFVERARLLQGPDGGQDAAAAREAIGRALALVPDHGGALALGVEIAEASGDPSLLHGALLALARRPDRRIAALERIARLLADVVGDRLRATDAYRAVLDAAPDHMGAHLWLARESLAHGRFSDAEKHYARAMAQDPPDDVRLEAALALGRLRRDAGDVGAAEQYLRVAFALEPDAAGLADDLVGLFEKLGRADDLRALLDRRARSRDPQIRLGALRRLAEIHAASDPASARAALEQILRTTPDDVAVLRRVVRLRLDAGEHHGAVAAAERLAALAAPDRRVRVLSECAEILLQRPEARAAARRLAERALDLDPTHGPAAAVVEASLLADDDAAGLAEYLAGRIENAAPADRAELRLRRAQTIATRLPDRLADALGEARAAWAEGAADAVPLVAELAGRLGRGDVEAAALHAVLGGIDRGDARRPPLVRKLAEIAWSLRDLDLALACTEELRAAAPDDPILRAALADIHEARGDARALAAVLSDPAPAPGSAEALRAAEAWKRAAAAGSDPRLACDDLLRAAELVPDDVDLQARVDRALAAADRHAERLVRLLGRVSAPHLGRADRIAALRAAVRGMPPEQANVVHDRLVDLGDAEAVRDRAQALAAQGDLAAAGDLLVRAAEAQDDPPGSARLLRFAIQLLRGREEALAERALRAVLAIEPEDGTLVGMLAEILERHGSPDAAAAWERAAGLPGGPKDSLVRAARVAARSGDDARSMDLLEQAVQADPADGERLAALGGAYRQVRRFPELAALLARRAELLPEGDDRAAVREEIALLAADELHDPRGAARMLLGVAAEGAPDRAARAAVRAAQLARSGEDAALLAEALGAVARHAAPEGAAAALAERARLLFEAGRGADARRDLEEALRRDSRNLDALAALGDLAVREGDDARSVDLWGRWLEAAPQGADLLPALAALARGCAAVGKSSAALAHAQRWVDLAPGADSLDALARAASAAEQPRAAAEALQRLIGAVQGEAAQNARLRLAEAQASGLADPAAAVRTLLEVPKELPQRAAATLRAVELAARTDDVGLQIDAHAALLEGDLPPARRVTTLLRRSDLLEVRGDHDPALAHLREARALAPGTPDVLLRLARHARKAGQMAECLDALEELAAAKGLTDEAKVEVHLAAADAAASLGRTDDARRHCRIAASMGRAESADAILDRVLDPARDRADLYALEQRRLGRIPPADAAARRGALRRLADMALGAGEEDAAEKHLLQLREAAPADGDSFVELVRLYEHRGSWRKLADLLQGEAKRLPAGAARADLDVRRGRLLEENLGAEADAAEAYASALAAAPEHAPALESLADLAFRRADWADVEVLYEKLADRGEIRAFEREMRKGLAAERMGRLERAVEFFARAAQTDPAAPDAAEAHARVALALGRHGEAADAYGEALGRLPRGERDRAVELRLAQARSLVAAGRLAEAVRPLEKLAESPDGAGTALSLLVRVQEGIGDVPALRRALERLAEVTGETSTRVDIEIRLSDSYASEDPRVALRHALAADAIRADDPATLTRIVRLGLAAAEPDSALAAFDSLGRADPAAARDPQMLYDVALLVARTDAGGGVLRLVESLAERATDALSLAAPVLVLGKRSPAAAAEALSRVERVPGADAVLGRLAADLAATGADSGLVRRAAAAGIASDPGSAGAHEALAAALDPADRSAVGARFVASFLRRTPAPRVPWEPRPLPAGAVSDLLEPAAKGPFARALAAAAPVLAAGWADRTARGTPLSFDGEADESWLGRGDAMRGALLRAMSLVPGIVVQAQILEGRSQEVIVEGGEPPRVLLAGGFPAMSDGAKLFALVRGLLRIRFGEGVVPRSDPAEVLGWCRILRRALVGAAVEGVAADGLARAGGAIPHAKRIVLSKVLDEGLKDATVESVEETLDALRRGAARLALTMTGDPAAALEALAGPDATTAEARAARVRADPDLSDLARFASGGGWI